MKLSKLFQACAYEIEYQTIGNNVNYAFIENKADKTLFVYFQGSHEKIDWIRNFLFTQKVYKMFRIHKGFYNAYVEARSMLIDKICECDINGDYKWLKIVIVGYSHGGALAQIFHEEAIYHRNDIKDDIFTYAFESPRCLKVPKKYKHLWANLTTTRCNTDLITHLPPMLFGYDNLGKMLKIKGDVSLVKNHVPYCIKSHFPQCVLNGLLREENE